MFRLIGWHINFQLRRKASFCYTIWSWLIIAVQRTSFLWSDIFLCCRISGMYIVYTRVKCLSCRKLLCTTLIFNGIPGNRRKIVPKNLFFYKLASYTNEKQKQISHYIASSFYNSIFQFCAILLLKRFRTYLHAPYLQYI